ncbi:MAG: rRNA pseudouridine synthase [Alistipes sp.]|nr:rRNA pseudouridine synthase [Alistipes sp.]
MKEFKNDSTATLSRFAKDKRLRTVKAERVERRPRIERNDESRASFSEQPKRRSFNPNFDSENRPVRESAGSRYGDKPRGGKPSFGGEHRSSSERPSHGNKPAFGGKSKFSEKENRFGKGAGKGFGAKKAYGNKFDKDERSDKGPRGGKFQKRDDKPKSYPKYNPDKQIGEMRLNRYLAQSGLCSRREADDYIQAGLVTVNGVIVTELGTKVMPSDEVRFSDSVVKGEKKVYLVLNKPKGYVTTLDDPHATKTVMDLVKDACSERIYPVGRLDKNSLGLLIFTNDGDMTRQLTHPSYQKKKIYQVTLDKPLTRGDMDKISEGITLEDGEIYADEISYVKEDKKEIGIEIHSGRNRIVRRIFEHLGYVVQKLDRVYYAGLTKKNLKRGAWRFLTKDEVSRLKSGQYE